MIRIGHNFQMLENYSPMWVMSLYSAGDSVRLQCNNFNLDIGWQLFNEFGSTVDNSWWVSKEGDTFFIRPLPKGWVLCIRENNKKGSNKC